MASISRDKTLRVWDVENSTAVYTHDKLTDNPNYLRWSPDGKMLCMNSNNSEI